MACRCIESQSRSRSATGTASWTTRGKCRYLHGHNGVLEVDIEGESLDERGMVMDFGEVGDLVKGWVGR